MKTKAIRKSTFAYYGLDKSKNFLEAPVCECGCGSRANIILETDDDICGFMHTMLEEWDCDHCAIFTVKNNDEVLMGVKLSDGIKCYKCKADGHRNLFKDIQDDFGSHCYGILEQADETSYKILMD